MTNRSAPRLLLIRPEVQSRALAARLGVSDALIAPVIALMKLPAPPLRADDGVIVTSANGARFGPALAGHRAWCVGARSAEVARARGADIAVTCDDAEALVTHLATHPPQARLVHLAGTHRTGDIVTRLAAAGLKAELREVYDQKALPVAPALREAVEGERPSVLPLYSPRSARLLGQGVARLGPNLHVIALSPAIALAWHEVTGGEAEICPRKHGDDMERRVRAALSG